MLPEQIEQVWQNYLSQLTQYSAIALVLSVLYAIFVFWPSILAFLQPADRSTTAEDRSINAAGATITQSLLNTGTISVAPSKPVFGHDQLAHIAAELDKSRDATVIADMTDSNCQRQADILAGCLEERGFTVVRQIAMFSEAHSGVILMRDINTVRVSPN